MRDSPRTVLGILGEALLVLPLFSTLAGGGMMGGMGEMASVSVFGLLFTLLFVALIWLLAPVVQDLLQEAS